MKVSPCVFLGFLETWSRLEENRGCIIGFYHFMYYRVLEKKNQNFFFFLNDVDVENCGASRGFSYIYIDYKLLIHANMTY